MNDAVRDRASWAWLAVKAGIFLLLSLNSVEVVVVAYQQF